MTAAGRTAVTMAKSGLSPLALAPVFVLAPFAPGTISVAYAQCVETSFTTCPTITTPSSASAAQLQAVTATSVGIVRSEVTETVMTIGDRVRDISRDLARGKRTGAPSGESGPSGLSAGSDPAKYGVWLDASGAYLSNDDPVKGNQGRSVAVLSGVDTVIGNDWVVGLATGYTSAALSVASFGSGGNRHSTGVVIGPYASYVIDQNWSVDGNLNYTRLENTVITPGSGGFPGNRYTAGVNTNYFADVGPVSLTGFGGYTYAFERDETFNDNANKVFPATSIYYGAFKIGVEASYPIGNFEPYLPLSYEYETTSPRDGTGRQDIVVGLGLRYTLGDALKFGLVATTMQLRSHQQEDTIAANLRYSF
jgi:outer membrane autotransporter protein